MRGHTVASKDRDDLSAPETRTRILDALVKDLQDAGGEVTISAGKVAERLGVSVKTFREHVAGLCADGHLVKVRAGLAGTTLSLPAKAKAIEPVVATPAVEPAEGLRQRLRTHLADAVRDAGGEVLITSDRLADALGAKTTTIAYHLKALSDLGYIVTDRAGRRGTRIRLGRGGEAGNGGGVVLGVRPRAVSGRGGVRYCPFCGTKLVGSGWTYCGACGQKLPV